MKKLLVLLLVLTVLFAGCGTPAQQSDQPSAETTVTTPVQLQIIETKPAPASDPYEGMTKAQFYANYTPATGWQDAQYRSRHGFLSGSLEVPGQDLVRAAWQPTSKGYYVRNADSYYTDDGNTYIVVDSYGNQVMHIYRGGGYITLEEVAAYMYAFGGDGSFPANYVSKKSTKPSGSIWGEYLRVNHSYYSNDTDKYPYEPELPGQQLRYYEMDIGTTGTVTPGRTSKAYNDGVSITRGAARLVYARQDINGNGVYEQDEVHVFYTHNHYNDFTEYLNYYGGWGDTFGNITGGGEFDSSSRGNPTPYVPSTWESLIQAAA